MSYVVCCNTTNDEDITTGNKQPNSFTNNFKTPLIVEPNSEVAVESIKINRSAQYDGQIRGRRFFLYWGPEQTDAVGVAPILCRDVTKTGVEIKLNFGSNSIRGYARELQDAINQAPLSPNLFGNCEVTIQLDAVTNEWKGFSYIFEQRTTQLDSKAVLTTIEDMNAGTIKNRFDNAIVPVAYAANVFTASFDNTVAQNAQHIRHGSNVTARCNKMVPLSPIDGVAQFTIGPAKAQWADSFRVGLTRPATVYVNGGQPPQMPRSPWGGEYYDGGVNECYMDYAVEWDAIADLLYVIEYTKINNIAGTFWNRRNITYWGAGKNIVNQLNLAALLVIGGPGQPADRIQFVLQGNELHLGFEASGAPGILWAVNSGAGAAYNTNRGENFRPTTNSTEWLLPAVAFWAQNQTIEISIWNGIDLTNPANVNGTYLPPFPSVENPAVNNINLPIRTPRDYIPGGDWNSYLMGPQLAQGGRFAHADPERIIHNDRRYSQVSPALAGADPFIYSNVTAFAEDYSIVMIVGEEYKNANLDEEDQVQYVIPRPNHHANMSRELGFDGDLAILKSSIFAAVVAPAPPIGQRIEFLSLNAGLFTVHSAFVRVNNLTFRSFNGATQSRSQILYHLPTFSNEGKQFGDLYYAPGEKTYIKLHNSHRETINQIAIDIVGRNERVVTDLTGATVVALHIRRCHSDLEENSYC